MAKQDGWVTIPASLRVTGCMICDLEVIVSVLLELDSDPQVANQPPPSYYCDLVVSLLRLRLCNNPIAEMRVYC